MLFSPTTFILVHNISVTWGCTEAPYGDTLMAYMYYRPTETPCAFIQALLDVWEFRICPQTTEKLLCGSCHKSTVVLKLILHVFSHADFSVDCVADLLWISFGEPVKCYAFCNKYGIETIILWLLWHLGYCKENAIKNIPGCANQGKLLLGLGNMGWAPEWQWVALIVVYHNFPKNFHKSVMGHECLYRHSVLT